MDELERRTLWEQLRQRLQARLPEAADWPWGRIGGWAAQGGQALGAAATVLGWQVSPSPQGPSLQLHAQGVPDGHDIRWGASDRNYLSSPVLIWRCPAPLPDEELLAALWPADLLEEQSLALYQRLVDSTQTSADPSLPAELRWIAVLPAVGPLRRRFPALSGSASDPGWLERWWQALQPPLAVRQTPRFELGGDMVADPLGWPEERFSLVLRQGQMALRIHMPQPDEHRLLATRQLVLRVLRAMAQVAVVPAAGGTGLLSATD
ncbi:hypothetical protein [Ideonella livida]|uniref:Uncharacterized protein n=1 Tax=Ideonella livida TaxID=2707176 RepID=A0A7C9PG22_9BURK|nr:hypothetical protein [Ideonella livida]NDY90532.1 hypothetical protein [Ideonella livida]